MASLIEKTGDKPDTNGEIPHENGINEDQTDLAANRRSIPTDERAENQRVHCFWDVFALGSILTFAADIGSDLLVAALYYKKGEYEWFGVTLGFVVFTSVSMQVFSAKWFHEDKERRWFMYLVHALQMGPALRYWNVSRTGWRTRRTIVSRSEYHNFLSQWRDICMLRLFEAYLESAPQLTLQLYILSYRRRFDMDSDLLTAIAAACSLVSLAWAIVAYQKALRDVQCDKVSWVGFFCQIMWRLFMVASRIVALVIFASYFSLWIGVIIAIHWLLMFVFLVTQDTKFCMDNAGYEHPLREVLFDGMIAFIHIFSFFNITEGMTRVRLLVFYTLMFIENCVFVLLWYPHRALFGDVAPAAITIVIAGFFLGLFSMFMYYHFYHPNIQDQGMCFRTRKGFDVVGKYSYSNIWCCCCEVSAVRSAHSDNRTPSCLCHKPSSTCCSSTAAVSDPSPQDRESMAIDVDIIPRSMSLESESVPQLVHSRSAAYLRCQGRQEVTMQSPVPSDWI